MIELLHPVTLGVAVACVPVAAVAVSGAIDLIAHRQHVSAAAAIQSPDQEPSLPNRHPSTPVAPPTSAQSR